MSGEAIALVIALWAGVAMVTTLMRLHDTDKGDGGDGSGSIAAGVLWPLYLPYRLFLIVWSLKP